VDSLNLNVTCPTTAATNLPVLVFIAGGGFFLGGNWFPQYDFGRLVRLSVEQGTPFIGIVLK
jgi:carboxylesterase type B